MTLDGVECRKVGIQMRDEERIEMYQRFGFLDWKSELHQQELRKHKYAKTPHTRGHMKLKRMAERLLGKLGAGLY